MPAGGLLKFATDLRSFLLPPPHSQERDQVLVGVPEAGIERDSGTVLRHGSGAIPGVEQRTSPYIEQYRLSRWGN
jgi:hypothetical protein